jgi:MFS family permease
MENIAVGWLVLEMTDSPWLVALVGFYRMAPLLLVGFVSGLISDRFGRRAVILSSQSINVITPIILVILLATNMLQYWHIALASVILGAMWALDWPARRSVLPDLLGKKRTVDGMLLEGFSQNISRMIGPFLAGVLIRFVGTTGCIASLAIFSAAGLLILLGLAKTKQAASQSGKIAPWTSISEGLRYIRQNPSILGVMLITVAMNNLVFPYMALLPVFARDVLGQGPLGLGILGAGHGVGTLLGLFVVIRIRHSWKPTWVFAIGSFLQSTGLLAFAISSSFPLSVLLLCLAGIAQSSFAVMQSTIVLVSAADEMRARSMGTLNFAIGAGSLGRIQIGALASAFGAQWALGLACGASALLILAITAALPGFRRNESA